MAKNTNRSQIDIDQYSTYIYISSIVGALIGAALVYFIYDEKPMRIAGTAFFILMAILAKKIPASSTTWTALKRVLIVISFIILLPYFAASLGASFGIIVEHVSSQGLTSTSEIMCSIISFVFSSIMLFILFRVGWVYISSRHKKIRG